MAGTAPAPHLAVEDIADIAANVLSNRNWSGKQAIELLGPVDLSYDQMAVALTRHLGRPVRYEQVSAESVIAQSIAGGMSPSAAQAGVDIYSYLEKYYSPDPAIDRSRTPTTFAGWLVATYGNSR